MLEMFQRNNSLNPSFNPSSDSTTAGASTRHSGFRARRQPVPLSRLLLKGPQTHKSRLKSMEMHCISREFSHCFGPHQPQKPHLQQVIILIRLRITLVLHPLITFLVHLHPLILLMQANPIQTIMLSLQKPIVTGLLTSLLEITLLEAVGVSRSSWVQRQKFPPTPKNGIIVEFMWAHIPFSPPTPTLRTVRTARTGRKIKFVLGVLCT